VALVKCASCGKWINHGLGQACPLCGGVVVGGPAAAAAPSAAAVAREPRRFEVRPSRFEPTTEERTASFLANMFQSQAGQLLVVLAAATLGLGVLTDTASFFIATALFLVCAGIAGHFKGEREKRVNELLWAFWILPQPDLPEGLKVFEAELWAKANPHLVRRAITRDEARRLAREKGVDEHVYDPFITEGPGR
jgi:hypothetical protein